MDGLDTTWAERLDLFGASIAAALIAGLVCPLVGVFLHLRRTSFYGIALPQFATAGVVFGFVLLPWWVATIGLSDLTPATALSDAHAARNYHFAWAAAFTFAALGALLLLGRRAGSEVGRMAAAYAIATAATFLLGRFSAVGKGHVDELLRGELILIGIHGLETVAAVLGLVLLGIAWFWRDLLVVSFDPEAARVLEKRVTGFEALLVLLTGVTVSVGTMTFGPTMLFGLLVLPPLAARPFARSMPAFLTISSAIGVVAVLVGTWVTFEFDLPLGPAIVAAAACALLLGLGARSARR